MFISKIFSVFTILIFSQLTFAIDDKPPTLNKDVAPTIPNEADDSRNIPQPEVRIIRKQGTVVEEYRINGRLRYIKITPSSGKPYYMVDTDGDGIVETRNDNLANPPINQWILLKW